MTNPLTSAVFCRPTVRLQNVMASIALFNGQVLSVTAMGNNDKVKNVTDTDGQFKGRPINGEAFGDAVEDE